MTHPDSLAILIGEDRQRDKVFGNRRKLAVLLTLVLI